jgi:hypothetical protein
VIKKKIRKVGHVACLKKQADESCILAGNVSINHLEGLGICNRISVQQAINMGKLGIWFYARFAFELIGSELSALYFGRFTLIKRTPNGEGTGWTSEPDWT